MSDEIASAELQRLLGINKSVLSAAPLSLRVALVTTTLTGRGSSHLIVWATCMPRFNWIKRDRMIRSNGQGRAAAREFSRLTAEK
jgi:hypothetical protein